MRTDQAKDYAKNLGSGLARPDGLREAGVRKLVSPPPPRCTEPEKQPIEETDATVPTNPYGETKLAFERTLHWFEGAYGLRHVSLRYFNAAGASERNGERHDPETHFVPIVLDVARGKREAVTVFGEDYPTPDGTCVRDYIHVIDLARAHVLALEALADGRPSTAYNLGCGGAGYSVKQVIESVWRVTGREILVRTGARRAGDPAVLVASSDRIRRELGWAPRYGELDVIVETAWRWLVGRGGR